jgi:ABC-type xylose transport system permease subunit
MQEQIYTFGGNNEGAKRSGVRSPLLQVQDIRALTKQ